MASKWWILVLVAVVGCGTTTDTLETSVTAPTTSAAVSSSTSDAAATTTTIATTTTTSTSAPSTSTSTTLAATTSTSAVPDPGLGIVLSADGLGVVSFGDPMDEVLTVLSDLVGAPSAEDVVDPAFSDATSGFGYYRGVYWREQVSLYVEFVDWDIDMNPLDGPEFSYWATGSPLQTAEGIGPGTPWREAAEIYGDRAETSPEGCVDWWYFFIDRGDNTGLPFYLTLHGVLDGDPSLPETSVTWMAAGREAFPQGC